MSSQVLKTYRYCTCICFVLVLLSILKFVYQPTKYHQENITPKMQRLLIERQLADINNNYKAIQVDAAAMKIITEQLNASPPSESQQTTTSTTEEIMRTNKISDRKADLQAVKAALEMQHSLIKQQISDNKITRPLDKAKIVYVTVELKESPSSESQKTSTSTTEPIMRSNKMSDGKPNLQAVETQASNRRKRGGKITLTADEMEFIKKETNELVTKEPYKERMERILHQCDGNKDTSIDLSRIIYNDQHQYVMCEIPKAASTSWRRFWWHLSGLDGYKDVPKEKLILGHGPITTLNKIPLSQALSKLRKYTKFFITRHPFDRLVSVHSSKFTKRFMDIHYYKDTVGKRAANRFLPAAIHNFTIRNYKGDDFEAKLSNKTAYQKLAPDKRREVYDAVRSLNVGEIDFETFIKFVLSESPKSADVHWRSHFDLCNPCAINYDFIIDFDNLHKESNLLLRYLQRNDPDSKKVFLDGISNLIKSNYTFDMLNSLPKQTIVDLKRLYKRDFDIFGFSDYNLL